MKSVPNPTPPLRNAHWIRCLEEADLTREVLPKMTDGHVLRDGTPEAYASRGRQILRAMPLELRTACEQAIQEIQRPTWLQWVPDWVFPWSGPAFLVGAFVLGLFSHQFGPSRLMDILAFPLLGLMLWNQIIFLLAIGETFRNPEIKSSPLPASLGQLTGTSHAVAALAWERFSERENRWMGPAKRARFTVWLHWAAILLAAGVVAGMYVRGLAKEFHAGWESTFLNASGVETFLSIVLGPAHWLSHIPLPSLTDLQQMRLPLAEPIPHVARAYAAPIIHLWAITAGLSIGLTRLILILVERSKLKALTFLPKRRLAWLQGSLELEAQAREAPRLCQVVPIYYGPEDRLLETLRPVLHGLWQHSAQLQMLPPISLADEEAYFAAHPFEGQEVVVLFSLAATPETDVHGETLRQILDTRPKKILVGLDAFSFDSRHEGLPEHAERKQRRLDNWQRLLTQMDVQDWVLLDSAAETSPQSVLLSRK